MNHPEFDGMIDDLQAAHQEIGHLSAALTTTQAQLAAAAARLTQLERVAKAARAWSAHWHLGTCYPCLTGNDCEPEMTLHRTLDAALAALDADA